MSRGDTNLEHTAGLTMYELNNWCTGMIAVLLNVVPKELMSCWIKATTVISAMVHWSGTELGTQGSMELDGFRIQSPTQPGNPRKHITGRSKVTHQCARVGGDPGSSTHNGKDIHPAWFSTMRIRYWSRACEKQLFGEAMMNPPKMVRRNSPQMVMGPRRRGL